MSNKDYVSLEELSKLWNSSRDSARKYMELAKLKPVIEVPQGAGVMRLYSRADVDTLTPEKIAHIKLVMRRPTLRMTGRGRAIEAGINNMVPNARHRMNALEDRVVLLEQQMQRLLIGLGEVPKNQGSLTLDEAIANVQAVRT